MSESTSRSAGTRANNLESLRTALQQNSTDPNAWKITLSGITKWQSRIDSCGSDLENFRLLAAMALAINLGGNLKLLERSQPTSADFLAEIYEKARDASDAPLYIPLLAPLTKRIEELEGIPPIDLELDVGSKEVSLDVDQFRSLAESADPQTREVVEKILRKSVTPSKSKAPSNASSQPSPPPQAQSLQAPPNNESFNSNATMAQFMNLLQGLVHQQAVPLPTNAAVPPHVAAQPPPAPGMQAPNVVPNAAVQVGAPPPPTNYSASTQQVPPPQTHASAIPVTRGISLPSTATVSIQGSVLLPRNYSKENQSKKASADNKLPSSVEEYLHAALTIGDDLVKYVPGHDELQYCKYIRWIFDLHWNYTWSSVMVLDERFRYEQATGSKQWSDRPWEMVVMVLVQKTGHADSERPERPEQTVCLNFNREKGCSFKHCKFPHFCVICPEKNFKHGAFHCNKRSGNANPGQANSSAAPGRG